MTFCDKVWRTWSWEKYPSNQLFKYSQSHDMSFIIGTQTFQILLVYSILCIMNKVQKFPNWKRQQGRWFVLTIGLPCKLLSSLTTSILYVYNKSHCTMLCNAYHMIEIYGYVKRPQHQKCVTKNTSVFIPQHYFPILICAKICHCNVHRAPIPLY